MNLITALNRLGQQINTRFPEIDSGGCAVYAAEIGKELRKRGIESRGIVGAYGQTTNLDEIRPQLKNSNSKTYWNQKDIYFFHVGLEFEHKGKVRHYDSTGIKPNTNKFGSFYLYNGRLTLDELIGIAKEKKGWNDSFNRRHIPALRRHIQKFMDTYVKD